MDAEEALLINQHCYMLQY